MAFHGSETLEDECYNEDESCLIDVEEGELAALQDKRKHYRHSIATQQKMLRSLQQQGKGICGARDAFEYDRPCSDLDDFSSNDNPGVAGSGGVCILVATKLGLHTGCTALMFAGLVSNNYRAFATMSILAGSCGAHYWCVVYQKIAGMMNFSKQEQEQIHSNLVEEGALLVRGEPLGLPLLIGLMVFLGMQTSASALAVLALVVFVNTLVTTVYDLIVATVLPLTKQQQDALHSEDKRDHQWLTGALSITVSLCGIASSLFQIHFVRE